MACVQQRDIAHRERSTDPVSYTHLDVYKRQIIPKTDTPGAKEAGVPTFVEMMLNDCYEQPEHRSFQQGVDALLKADFLDQTPQQRTATLLQLQTDTKKQMEAYNVQQSKICLLYTSRCV